MIRARPHFAGALALVLAGCTSTVAMPEPSVRPDSFYAYLATEYLRLAEAEAARYDGRDARSYRLRAAASLRGETVDPESLAARVLPADQKGELSAARLRLEAAIERAGRILSPKHMALAQAAFDCWIEEQEEAHQPEDISVCRNAYLTAIADVEADLGKSIVVLLPGREGEVGAVTLATGAGAQSLTRANEAAALSLDETLPHIVLDDEGIQTIFGDALRVEPQLPVRFLLYFEAGTDRLTAESTAQLGAIRTTVAGRPAPDVSVVGHTDTKGAAETNERLARRRAEAVATLLLAEGLSAESLVVDSFGETDPVRPTADDVDEPLNRRVEVTVR